MDMRALGLLCLIAVACGYGTELLKFWIFRGGSKAAGGYP
jgi:hypothetical protein